jgi:hypothetical protein
MKSFAARARQPRRAGPAAARTLVGDVLPVALVERDVRARGLAHELLDVLGPEGRVAAEEHVRDDPAPCQLTSTAGRGRAVPGRPDVDGLAVALLL